MSDPTRHWSCYTTEPQPSLEIFEQTRQSGCPYSHEHNGFYMFLNYGDVRSAMADHKTYPSEPQVLRPMLPRNPIPALEMDPPRHTHWRAIFNRAITPKSVRAMEAFIRDDINRHIDGFIEKGSCDFVAELAETVPAETICKLVGIDDEWVPKIRQAAIEMFEAQGNPEEFGRRQAIFAELTVSQVHARRAQPRDDYLTEVANLDIDGRKIDDNDMVLLMAAFLGAGHHSTTSAMTSLVNEVFTRTDVRDELLREPTKINLAVEEALRLRPPFFGFFRRTTHPVKVAETDIPAGADVYVGWAAANRDAKMFPNPTEYVFDRPNNRHLSFGLGIHTCPGAPLARQELRILLELLLQRLPDLRVDTEHPTYKFGGGDYNYIPSLRISFTPGRPLTRT